MRGRVVLQQINLAQSKLKVLVKTPAIVLFVVTAPRSVNGSPHEFDSLVLGVKASMQSPPPAGSHP
eukprot:CAMPEP_0177265184 /NCGR_PEP_ID=MMETSP0367-20130122/61967_1 /TAXON_ID=447022 ORGANISM="Scrippsiella hangoei-like, Strain SHHI-4" /NCGR_SAMPLE_ID=MMETSP0367 /ASSEMBLY_ACC=CAM_ASM_000362 /LENGTH=65 /DNA_ID=CAMNT_0018720373 /DNA_START=102 /DNA_END=295 /DNA_ORIENTATION=-